MPRIMVVDDEPDALDLYVICLRGADREIVPFSSPKEALAALDKADWDVVITDVMMPEVDGFQLVEKVLHNAKGVPCIVVTGFGTDTTLIRALKTDCFGYINKPFDFNYLNLLVDKAIRSRGCSWSRAQMAKREHGDIGGQV